MGLHSSKRPPAPLKDTDYDHEINLVDDTVPPDSPSRNRSRPVSARVASSSPAASDSSSRRHSNVPLRKRDNLRAEITRRKFSKYQDRHLGSETDLQQGASREDVNSAPADDEEERGRAHPRVSTDSRRQKQIQQQTRDTESAIDVLFENQRGGILCGMRLFSAKALGNLDPSPWTNIALKTSATNITNAQVPDPSWEWAWKDWSVNHSDGVDEDGWEYSFAFAKAFSWHGPSWWNSYVRRRAWTRRRVKKRLLKGLQEAHMLNSDYFTIHPSVARSRSRASSRSNRDSRYSVKQPAKQETEDDIIIEDITDIHALMKALRFSRIDREKTEAVENFIKNGGDELYYLRDYMHEIMRQFIFQASRRLLLTHLMMLLNEASAEQSKEIEAEKEKDLNKKRRLENLKAAVQVADEEVKKLEFWSDVKDMAEHGETIGAMDRDKGWDETWTGIDNSAPKDVISDRKLPGTQHCKDGEGNGTAIESESGNKKAKAKGKENE